MRKEQENKNKKSFMEKYNKIVNQPEAEKNIRELFVNDYFAPIAKEIFKNYKQANSVVLAFAQYWNDEGEDDCHDLIMPSTQELPDWKELFNGLHNKFYTDDDTNNTFVGYYDVVQNAIEAVFGERYGGIYLDGDENFIAAIAPYCKEDCSQDMDYPEAYLPYAIASREGDGFRIKIMGELVRVWQ